MSIGVIKALMTCVVNAGVNDRDDDFVRASVYVPRFGSVDIRVLEALGDIVHAPQLGEIWVVRRPNRGDDVIRLCVFDVRAALELGKGCFQGFAVGNLY